ESRERFVEEATILLNALETGVAQLDGKHYRQPARAIRPKPPASFHGRTYAAAVSPESIEIMAQLGVGLMVVPQKPYEMVAQDLVNYRDTFERVNGCAPPAPCAAVYVFCDEDADRARELGPKYIGNYYQSTMSHYELAGSHFTDTKGYEYYSSTSKAINRVGSDAAADAFVNLHVYGTPQECIDKIRWIQDIVGNETLMTVFRFGGIGYEEALRNIQLFARSVKPALQALPVMTHV
ncbi:LLM class flavin-dependent oxidoreductase, partial [Mycolicibacterium sp.]